MQGIWMCSCYWASITKNIICLFHFPLLLLFVQHLVKVLFLIVSQSRSRDGAKESRHSKKKWDCLMQKGGLEVSLWNIFTDIFWKLWRVHHNREKHMSCWQESKNITPTHELCAQRSKYQMQLRVRLFFETKSAPWDSHEIETRGQIVRYKKTKLWYWRAKKFHG